MASKACNNHMKQEESTCKAKIDYPCQWLYKVIGSDQEKLLQAINQTVQRTSCSITPSNSSRTGKYLCLNLEITVDNEEERNLVYKTLKEHPHVKIVL
jgi:putative lipoic acid-binding regulatory protein